MLVVNEAAGSELGTEVDGMPLLGGKGGDGFDSSVPLFIAWDSSAGKESNTLLPWLSMYHRQVGTNLSIQLCNFMALQILKQNVFRQKAE